MENKIKQLRNYVIRSVLIAPLRREELLRSLSALSEKQIDQLTATFQKADGDQHSLIVGLLAKNTDLWEEISQTVKSEQKASLLRQEAGDRKNEEESLSSLEAELDSILN